MTIKDPFEQASESDLMVEGVAEQICAALGENWTESSEEEKQRWRNAAERICSWFCSNYVVGG